MYWRRRRLPAIPDHSHDSIESRRRHNTVFKKVVVNAGEKPVFEAKIRFENLNALELGALLCAIDLPAGLRHQFGMAKPYGLGVMRVSIQRIEIMSPEARYRAFFESKPQGSAAQLCNGLSKDEASGFKEKFAKWHGQDSVDALWGTPRFRELAALLAWDELEHIDFGMWNCMTRYLEFGKLATNGNTFDYNEYLCVGHGDPGFPPTGNNGWPKPRQERRRALPLATQVLDDARAATGKLPRDCRPSFIPPNQQAPAPAQDNRPRPQRNREHRRHQ